MRKTSHQLGFTMIELLIVITILGILATAVLSAINPIEQINRGRDTGSQGDAEQLLSAIDRYNAFQGYFPWQTAADDGITSIGVMNVDGNLVPVPVTAETPFADLDDDDDDRGDATDYAEADDCAILDRLSTGNETVNADCTGAQEIKNSFVSRLTDTGTRTLYVYNNGDPGASTYVCFIPQSGAFKDKAIDRCANDTEASPVVYGVGLPEDVTGDALEYICSPDIDRADDDDAADGSPMVCLP